MSEQAALDKKAIRKEILALIIPIILESIFVYLAGIVSASLVGHCRVWPLLPRVLQTVLQVS